MLCFIGACQASGFPEAERFIEIAPNNFLKKHSSEPTIKNNIPDLAVCNNENTVNNLETGGNLGNCDRKVTFSIN